MTVEVAEAPASPVRRRRPQARSIETKRRIFEAAAGEFAKRGFDGASTRTIASVAGVKHPIVTYHFKTKIGLWQAVLTDLNEAWDARYQERLQGLRGVDELTTLRLILEEFIWFSAEHAEFHALMSDAAREPSDRLDWLLKQFVKPKLDRIVQLIVSAQEAGRFIQGDPVHLFYLFIGAVTRIFLVEAEVKSITELFKDRAAFVRQHVDLCMKLVFRD